MMHPDDYGFSYSSESDWDREAAREIGYADQDRAWICTDRDVWHKNPFYTGPAVRHPEEDNGDEDDLPAAPALPDYAFDDIPF